MSPDWIPWLLEFQAIYNHHEAQTRGTFYWLLAAIIALYVMQLYLWRMVFRLSESMQMLGDRFSDLERHYVDEP